MWEALSVYAEYMRRKASETVPKEGESIAKKPRTENSDSNNTSVPSTSEIVVLEPAKGKDEGETSSSSEDESQNAETPKTVELLRRKSALAGECREKNAKAVCFSAGRCWWQVQTEVFNKPVVLRWRHALQTFCKASRKCVSQGCK